MAYALSLLKRESPQGEGVPRTSQANVSNSSVFKNKFLNPPPLIQEEEL